MGGWVNLVEPWKNRGGGGGGGGEVCMGWEDVTLKNTQK
jgi:hypothetical protein